MGRNEQTDNAQSQPDKDQGSSSNPAKEPWKDRGTDEEVRGDRGSPTSKSTVLRRRLRHRFGALRAKRGRPSEPAVLSTPLVWCLRLTLFVDGLAAVWLALMELDIDTGLVGTFATGLLFVVGIANAWALVSLRRETLSWPRDVAIAQALVASLALYVAVGAWRGLHWRALMIAVVVGIIALWWLIRLGKAVTLQWSKTAAFVVAVFPLAGLVQFWLQTEYLPSTSLPLVNVTSDLSPLGREGSIIRLSATVTLHNRGAVPVTTVGGLMRMTQYPRTISPPVSLEDISAGLSLGGSDGRDFRKPSINPSTAELNFVRILAGGSLLTPGQTSTSQFEVDIDSTSARLARLSFNAAFLTERRIGDVSTCPNPMQPAPRPIYRSREPIEFFKAAGQPIKTPDGSALVCADYHLKPISVLQRLEDHPAAIRISVVLHAGEDLLKAVGPDLELPRLFVNFGDVTGNTFMPASLQRLQQIQDSYPMITQSSTAEYAPTEPTPTQPGEGH